MIRHTFLGCYHKRNNKMYTKRILEIIKTIQEKTHLQLLLTTFSLNTTTRILNNQMIIKHKRYEI